MFNSVLDADIVQARLTHKILVGGVGNRALDIINSYFKDVKTVCGGTDNLVQAFILSRLFQFNPAETQYSGQGKTLIYLMIEILCQKQGKLMVLVDYSFPGVVGYKNRQSQDRSQDQNKGTPGKKLDKLKRASRIGLKKMLEQPEIPQWSRICSLTDPYCVFLFENTSSEI
jgi:hypothetical protein